MQLRPSHHPVSWMSGVWPLRILVSSCLGFLRFIVSTISADRLGDEPHTGACAPDGCRTADSGGCLRHQRSHARFRDTRCRMHLASRRTHARLGSRFCSLCGSSDLVAERTRSRSILLRPRNRSPNHGTRSAFPAGFPHPSRCHHGKRPVGRHEVVRDTPGFPAYSQMRTAPLPARGATFCLRTLHCPLQTSHLRTVIVTAAVYRGLDSRLRPKPNL